MQLLLRWSAHELKDDFIFAFCKCFKLVSKKKVIAKEGKEHGTHNFQRIQIYY